MGEGYHNFHHIFEGDYRNGVRWYHWDPTKWMIRSMEVFGQTYRLNRVSPLLMLKKRMLMEQKRLVEKGVQSEKLNQLRVRVEEAQKRFRELKEEHAKLKKAWRENSRERVLQMKAE